jgi:DNA-binding NtrC family response regulator
MARILIVDDQASIRQLLARAFSLRGHEAIEAANGAEAIALYRAAPTDVVIMDLVMPEKDGVETIGELKREFPNVRVVAVSGGGMINAQDHLDWAQLIGALRTFQKPFRIPDMVAAVEELVQS